MSPKDPFDRRRKPLQARARATVDAILQATAQVLVREGYAKATTNRIAEVAGVSIGTLYQYFPNKEALIVALVDGNIDRGMRVISERFAELRGDPPEQTVHLLIKTIIDIHTAEIELRCQLAEGLPDAKAIEKLNESASLSLPIARAFLEIHRESVVVEDLDLAAYMAVTTVTVTTQTAVMQRPETFANGTLETHLTRMICLYLFGTDHVDHTGETS